MQAYKELWTHKQAEEENALEHAEKMGLGLDKEVFVDPHAKPEEHDVSDGCCGFCCSLALT